MKKTFKFLVSTVTVVAVLATSVISALAATGSGTITVDNPQAGKTYSAYKIFNADVNGDSVKYTIVGEMTDDNNKALFGTGTPFEVNDGVVTVAADTKDSDVVAFLKETVKAPNFTAVATKTPTNGESVQFDLPYGYYFINTGAGSAVTITTVKNDATIIDKGDKPTWNPEDPSHPPTDSSLFGKLVSDNGEDGSYKTANTSGIKEDQKIEYFLISAHCPKYAGSNLVKSYIFTDTLPDGLTYNNDAKLYINGSLTTANFSVDTSAYSTDGTIVFTYTVPEGYEGAELAIKYTTTTNGNAEKINVNTADMDWTYIPYDPDAPTTDPDGNPLPNPTPSSTQDEKYPGDPTIPNPDFKPEDPVSPENPETIDNPKYDPDFPETPETKTTTTSVFKFEVKKLAAEDHDKSLSAQFRLYANAECTTEIAVVPVDAENGVYRIATADEISAPEADNKVGVIIAGDSTVFGLDNGTYYIKEVVAPTNYNLLEEPTEVTIDNEDLVDTNAVVVYNSKGSFLPSTGGMGTTIFIVAGSVLMAGGFIGFITKKRMSLKEEEQ